MKRLLFSCLTVSLLISGCSTSSKSTARHYKTEHYKTVSTQKLIDNGSHPKLGKLPKSDVPLVVNDDVLRWVNYFVGTQSGKERFARYLHRSGKYVKLMREEFARQGMPQDLVYVALIESGFMNQARSIASAVGTWQFIRATGSRYGLLINNYIDERRDPEKAVQAAARYLKDLYKMFGDWYLAMAAYNTGEGRVARLIKAHGTRDFWQLSKMRTGLYNETKQYVPKYIAATIIAKQPARFGLAGVHYSDPLAYDTAVITGQTDLRAVAEATNTPSEHIADLNAEVHSGITPPGQYELRVPPGTAHQLKRKLPGISRKYATTSATKMGSYRVKRGDNISTIARRHGVSTSQLMSINRLRSSRSLQAGRTLQVPQKVRVSTGSVRVVAINTNAGPRYGGRTHSVSPTKHIEVLEGFPKAEDRAIAPIIAKVEKDTKMVEQIQVAAQTPALTPTKTTTYKVRRGDTISRIARSNGVTTTDLRNWNNLRSNRLLVGQKLTLRTKSPASETQTVATAEPVMIVSAAKAPAALMQAVQAKPVVRAAPAKLTKYKVRRGDSLYAIATKFQVTVSDLKEWNHGLNPSRLMAGQTINLTQTAVNKNAAEKTRVATLQKTSTAYKVRRGETLGHIAQRHGMTVAELRKINGLSGNNIRAGQSLYVDKGRAATNSNSSDEALAGSKNKSAPATLKKSAPNANGPANKGTTVTASSAGLSERVQLRSAATTGKEIIHNVKAGDTLWDISREYDVKPSDIQRWNGMQQPSIKPGQKLTIRLSS